MKKEKSTSSVMPVLLAGALGLMLTANVFLSRQGESPERQDNDKADIKEPIAHVAPQAQTSPIVEMAPVRNAVQPGSDMAGGSASDANSTVTTAEPTQVSADSALSEQRVATFNPSAPPRQIATASTKPAEPEPIEEPKEKPKAAPKKVQAPAKTVKPEPKKATSKQPPPRKEPAKSAPVEEPSKFYRVGVKPDATPKTESKSAEPKPIETAPVRAAQVVEVVGNKAFVELGNGQTVVVTEGDKVPGRGTIKSIANGKVNFE